MFLLQATILRITCMSESNINKDETNKGETKMMEEKLIIELFYEINRKLDLLIDICKRDYTTGYKDLSKMLNETVEEK